MYRFTIRLTLAALAALALCSARPVCAQRGYTITEIPPLPGKAISDIFNGTHLNNHGTVVGPSYNTFELDSCAYVWKKKTGTQPLPKLGNLPFSFAYAINDRDQVVGYVGTTYSTDRRPVLWENGTVRDLGTLPGDPNAAAESINNRRHIVGWSGDITNFPNNRRRAVLWHKGQICVLPNLPGQPNACAFAVNERSQTVGFCGQDWDHSRPVVWDKGVVIALPTLGGDFNIALTINNTGQIVGWSTTETGETHATRWENGVLTDLGTLGGPFSQAFSIDNKGRITGTSLTSGGELRGFLWENGVMRDANELIPADSGYSIWYTQAINERGQITCWGTHNGEYRAFLLTPR